jgi:hypothetical protein
VQSGRQTLGGASTLTKGGTHAGHPNGAQVGATLFGLIETAKVCGLDVLCQIKTGTRLWLTFASRVHKSNLNVVLNGTNVDEWWDAGIVFPNIKIGHVH